MFCEINILAKTHQVVHFLQSRNMKNCNMSKKKSKLRMATYEDICQKDYLYVY